MFLTICLNPTIQKTLCYNSIVPGAVNRTANHRLDVSGKGINVTRVLNQLGKDAVHLTHLGGEMRPLFLSLCEKDGLSVKWAESNSQIRFCYTFITSGDVTEFVEESEPVAAGTEKLLLEKFNALLDTHSMPSIPHTLIISGTKAAGYSDTVIPLMVKIAKEKGLYVVLDIRGNDLIQCLKYEPDIVKPNLYEFASTFTPQLVKNNELSFNDTGAIEQIKSVMMDIVKKYRCRIVLTNGSREIYAAQEDNFFCVKFNPVKAVNTTGCGDAFTAGLAASLLPCNNRETEMDFMASINEGTRCGALNASLAKPGVIR